MIVKVCGITNIEDARAAVDAGANALGFNFYPKSPRCISLETAQSIIAALPASILKVGVYVNEAPAGQAAQLQLDVLQVHGELTQYPSARHWKAVTVKAGFHADLLDDPQAEAFLLDAPAADRYGGTGKTFDWKLVRGFDRRIIVAGGLDASNVALAIAVAQPWGVDACSRIESAPGKKDPRKMAAFIEAALKAI
ncbi:MAG: phosphoribosylanthranilate isomerase [Bryobacterales bacterium]|nr:phosphoribosylanthranilate isomerase [Bryobacterales bacterium]